MPRWTPESRAKAREVMSSLNRDPDFVRRRTEWTRDPARKHIMREQGQKVASACKSDIVVRSTWLAGLYRGNGSDAKRRHAAVAMKARMSAPEAKARAAAQGRTMDHSAAAKKGWITRRRNKVAARMKKAANRGAEL